MGRGVSETSGAHWSGHPVCARAISTVTPGCVLARIISRVRQAFQITLTDNGEPATTDAIGFTLWSGSTLVYSSNWNGAKTIEQVLGGGNLQVR